MSKPATSRLNPNQAGGGGGAQGKVKKYPNQVVGRGRSCFLSRANKGSLLELAPGLIPEVGGVRMNAVLRGLKLFRAFSGGARAEARAGLRAGLSQSQGTLTLVTSQRHSPFRPALFQAPPPRPLSILAQLNSDLFPQQK